MSQLFISNNWEEYELLDSGDGEKLERFGQYKVIRPEPKAIWQKEYPTVWQKVDARYLRSNTGGGNWKFFRPLTNWKVQWENIHFHLKPTGFKHVGIFPEQLPIWQILKKTIPSRINDCSVLNLFGYTGAATLVAAQGGAKVTHLDASKETITWARDNAVLSHLETKPIRWIVDDAITFVKREVRRMKKYDGIIIDPPKFGRGANGEVWKLDRDLSKLVELCTQLMSNKPLFYIINTYTTDLSSLSLANMLQQKFHRFPGKVDYGELALQGKNSSLILPCSIFASWLSTNS